MEQTRGEVVGKVEKMSQKFELVWTEVTEVANEMELIKQGILFNSIEIKWAKQVKAKAQMVLAQLEQEQKAFTVKLETLVKKNDSLQEKETDPT